MKVKLNRSVLTNEVYKLIRNRILTHSLAPGEKINIDQLARELEVSNIPIREALSRLSSEELVEVVPFKGVYVAELSLQDLDELYELRAYLEALATQKATPLIPDEKLQNIYEQMQSVTLKTPANQDELLQYVMQLNESLHGLIYQYCGNKRLQNLLQSYMVRMHSQLALIHPDLQLSLLQSEWEEHLQIVEQLMNRHVEGAIEASRLHLQNARIRMHSFFSL